MVYLAAHTGSRLCTRHEIAAAEDLSADYVGQILAKLKTVGLVRSHRGIHGGFSLGNEGAEITVADILRATEGEMDLAPCTQAGQCERSSECVTQDVWREAENALYSVFAAKKISELAESASQLERNRSLTFEI